MSDGRLVGGCRCQKCNSLFWLGGQVICPSCCREHYGAGIKLANIAHGMWSSAEDELEAVKAEIARLRRERDEAVALLRDLVPTKDVVTHGKDCGTVLQVNVERGGKFMMPGPDWSCFRRGMNFIRALRKEEGDD